MPGVLAAALPAIVKAGGISAGLGLLNMIMNRISTGYVQSRMQNLTQQAIQNTPVTGRVGSWYNNGTMLQGLNKSGNLMPKTFHPLPTVTPPAGVRAANVVSQLTGGIGRAASGMAPFALDIVGKGIQGAGATAGAALEGAGRTAGAVAQAVGNIPSHMNTSISDAQRQLYGGTPFDAVGGIMSDVGKAAGVGLTQAGKVGGVAAESLGNMIGGPISDAAALWRMQNIMQNIAANPGLRGGAGLVAARALSAARMGARKP
jgi:hypothetical protein